LDAVYTFRMKIGRGVDWGHESQSKAEGGEASAEKAMKVPRRATAEAAAELASQWTEDLGGDEGERLDEENELRLRHLREDEEQVVHGTEEPLPGSAASPSKTRPRRPPSSGSR
jgi:hypothetical protein